MKRVSEITFTQNIISISVAQLQTWRCSKGRCLTGGWLITNRTTGKHTSASSGGRRQRDKARRWERIKAPWKTDCWTQFVRSSRRYRNHHHALTPPPATLLRPDQGGWILRRVSTRSSAARNWRFNRYSRILYPNASDCSRMSTALSL